MSNFSEEKIERSNDGKFAPKATSETEIDLGGDGPAPRIPAPAQFAQLRPTMQQAAARAFGANRYADGHLETDNPDLTEKILRVDQGDRLYGWSRMGPDEPVGLVGESVVLDHLGEDVHGNPTIKHVNIRRMGASAQIQVSTSRAVDVGDNDRTTAENYLMNKYDVQLDGEHDGVVYAMHHASVEPGTSLNDATQLAENHDLSDASSDGSLARDIREYGAKIEEAAGDVRGEGGEAAADDFLQWAEFGADPDTTSEQMREQWSALR